MSYLTELRTLWTTLTTTKRFNIILFENPSVLQRKGRDTMRTCVTTNYLRSMVNYPSVFFMKKWEIFVHYLYSIIIITNSNYYSNVILKINY